jgi:predicted metalloprotease with PDZ domain
VTPNKAERGVKVDKFMGLEGLAAGDIIVEANGVSVSSESMGAIQKAWTAVTTKAKPNEPFKLKVRRGTTTMDVVVTPGATSVTRPAILEVADATPEQKRLRQGWITGGKKPLPK